MNVSFIMIKFFKYFFLFFFVLFNTTLELFFYFLNMCWIGKNNPQIATEDMKVFKIFEYKNGKILSPIILMEWKRGELVPRVKIPDSSVLRLRNIDKGYHSCRDLKIIHNYFNVRMSPYVRGAFVSPIYNVLIMCKREKFIMLTCIIPKGTKYYENEYGEIVSEQLILI